MDHHHDHHHGDHAHPHTHSNKHLLWAVAITLSFAAVEAASGWLANSLALMSDAGHMLTDASALALAAFASWLTQRPVSDRHSYGLVRAEVVAALVNGGLMLFIVASILHSAFTRMQQPPEVDAVTVMIIASIGLVINIVVAFVLHGGEQTLNTRAALLHVLGDLLGSVAALIGGIVIYYTGWQLVDPMLSILICLLIGVASLRLLREALHIIMEGVPHHLELPEVGQHMAKADGVASVHDLHIWTLSSGNTALSAHVVINDMRRWPEILQRLRHSLDHAFHIEHVTLQPEIHITQGHVPVADIQGRKAH